MSKEPTPSALLSADLHCHLLPGIDDGARDIEETLQLATTLTNYGISAAVVTPHIHAELYPNTREQILTLCQSVQTELRAHGINLTVLPGAEVRLDPESCRPETWVTLGDRQTHLLVELPPGLPMVATIESQLFAIQAAGITPIIAHPERQGILQKNPDLLARWVIERGILAQGTMSTLAGAAAERSVQTLENFLCRGLIHVMGTDVHHQDRRIKNLEQAATRLQQLVGPANAHLIQFENPQALISGGTVRRPRPTPEPRPVTWWRRLIAPLIAVR
ncbi:MAG: CpsB/CapC family capsule biosynthesis tyrosine phosphatase [Candidatus Sericytochromatia bacterium]|nr:CpsB/CapC family capsule biosynthesis tyrosine phosphatase [Candidatus Sericytochromatia bacterium]